MRRSTVELTSRLCSIGLQPYSAEYNIRLSSYFWKFYVRLELSFTVDLWSFDLKSEEYDSIYSQVLLRKRPLMLSTSVLSPGRRSKAFSSALA